jgi:uncharacterized protein (DUF885 family)
MRKAIGLIVLCASCGGAAAAPQGPKATATATSAAPTTTSAPKDASASAKRASEIADLVLADTFEQFPERATLLRAPGMTFDKLPDDSIDGARARADKHEALLAELRAMDRSALTGAPALAYDLALENLADQSRARVCRTELWTVSQSISGWQTRFAVLAQVQPVGTDALRAQALARFASLPAYIDAQITALREGMRLGYTAAQLTVHEVMDQLDALLAAPPEKSPFYSPADRDGNPDFQAKFKSLAQDGIYTAGHKYRDFLEKEYLPKARASISVSANPDGDACYRALLKLFSSVDLDPKEVNAKGLARLDEIETEMKALSAKSFGGVDVATLLQKFRTDPQYLYKDKDEMIAQATNAIARAKAAMPKVFHLMPASDVTVEPIPAFQEKSASAHYLFASLDGSRPAAYRIRLYQADKQSKISGEDIAFHETIPGHHLQVNIANQLKDLPALARFGFISGFGEGWGLYAERVADELGLYTSDADRFGMLSGSTMRAVRMVVDTGIHALGWDRQKAIDMIMAHTDLSLDRATAEIDRYIAWPGQSPSYMIGYLEIAALRKEAEAALGDKLDIRAFHDRVLENGAVPLPLLRSNIESWIKSVRGS